MSSVSKTITQTLKGVIVLDIVKVDEHKLGELSTYFVAGLPETINWLDRKFIFLDGVLTKEGFSVSKTTTIDFNNSWAIFQNNFKYYWPFIRSLQDFEKKLASIIW